METIAAIASQIGAGVAAAAGGAGGAGAAGGAAGGGLGGATAATGAAGAGATVGELAALSSGGGFLSPGFVGGGAGAGTGVGAGAGAGIATGTGLGGQTVGGLVELAGGKSGAGVPVGSPAGQPVTASKLGTLTPVNQGGGLSTADPALGGLRSFGSKPAPAVPVETITPSTPVNVDRPGVSTPAPRLPTFAEQVAASDPNSVSGAGKGNSVIGQAGEFALEVLKQGVKSRVEQKMQENGRSPAALMLARGIARNSDSDARQIGIERAKRSGATPQVVAARGLEPKFSDRVMGGMNQLLATQTGLDPLRALSVSRGDTARSTIGSLLGGR
jgi:hypothetical protein